jgi:hypothetical protein
MKLIIKPKSILNQLVCASLMRLGIGFILLVLLTLILAGFLIYRVGFELSFPRADSIYPRPVVELFLERGGELISIHDDVLLEEPILNDFKIVVRLSNNSSEPGLRREFAAGALLMLEGARVKDYELRGFVGAIGVSENGSVVAPVNASIVELFADKLDPWRFVEAELHLHRENGSGCVRIAYRGWIMDEDDRVLEPTSGSKEPYIARCPPENYPDNPPDSRWAGRDFMRYAVYRAAICPLRG